jgi:hypothetical protein
MKPTLLILLFLSVLLEAISEGLYDKGKKPLSKIIQGLMIIAFFGLMYCCAKIGFVWHIPVMYLLFRLLFFTFAYNKTRGLNPIYIGKTDIYDKYIAKYVMIAPVWYLILFGTIILILKFYE